MDRKTPDNSYKSILDRLATDFFQREFNSRDFTPISGGSINSSYKLKSDLGDFFVKVNSALEFPSMFQHEKTGLQVLAASGVIQVPKVYFESSSDGFTFLLMEFIEPGQATDSFWKKFGHSLAGLHLIKAADFGFESDNYIGSLPQVNTKTQKWTDFFAEYRLLFQAKYAFEQQKIGGDLLQSIERLCSRLAIYFPEERPSLLHGDLWSGNFLINQDSEPVLVDPAIYYGHREMDLAMTHLFGGFHPDFYRAYEEIYPLENGWRERIDLCNLYPLLVHVNLFGSSYLSSVKRILAKYC